MTADENRINIPSNARYNTGLARKLFATTASMMTINPTNRNFARKPKSRVVDEERPASPKKTAAVALDCEDPSVEDRQDGEGRQDWARAHEAKVEVRSDRCSDDGGNERQRQQPIGIAQHPVLLHCIVLRRQGTAGPDRLKFRLHFHPP